MPLGYDADPNTRQLVINEHEAVLVRAFFERCAAGESGAAVAAWANEAGHRTKVHGGKGGAKWTGRSVLQVVRNPICLGRRAHGQGTVEGVHDAIVDEDLARRAFAALDARCTREPSPRSKTPEWDQDPWMLRGLLRCAGCGRVMTTTTWLQVKMTRARRAIRARVAGLGGELFKMADRDRENSPEDRGIYAILFTYRYCQGQKKRELCELALWGPPKFREPDPEDRR